MSDDTVRLSIPIPKELNEELNTYIQWGLKADVVREVLSILISQAKEDRYIIIDLLKGNCELIRKATDVQNLNKSV